MSVNLLIHVLCDNYIERILNAGDEETSVTAAGVVWLGQGVVILQ